MGQVDVFAQVIVPVVGGLGIFMLGLEFMSDGIQALAVNRMRELLARFAGTPIKGVIAGTLITGIIQSSTAMTVMTVGLVNAGVVGLRPAISVIMGANIGTTLGNGLIALPLGPLGLLLGGVFALVYIFARTDKVKNIALACMGFALIFYGLNLMTAGLRPLRDLPAVMTILTSLHVETFAGLLGCVAAGAGITAMIHSSSATIGIIMGLGSAGVVDWHTAVAFSLGADLGTTITSWLASLNLSRNAKRAAYAHIAFNAIGVTITLPLFFVSMDVLEWAMGLFGVDPSATILADGKETYHLVPLAVGIYSTFFNIFNTVLLFPFTGTFERVLSRIGRDASEDVEDYSTPKYLTATARGNLAQAAPLLQREISRHLEAAALFLASARGLPAAPKDIAEHAVAADILNRTIRSYAAALFVPGQPHAHANLVASIIEEADFAASVANALAQAARRARREAFSGDGHTIVEAALDQMSLSLAPVLPAATAKVERSEDRDRTLLGLRERTLKLGEALKPSERGAILALLGTAERVSLLVARLDAERRSVPRVVSQAVEPLDVPLGIAAAPAQ